MYTEHPLAKERRIREAAYDFLQEFLVDSEYTDVVEFLEENDLDLDPKAVHQKIENTLAGFRNSIRN